MIRTQQYSPDTCSCIVVEQWDDALPSDQTLYSLVQLIRRGAEHSALVDASLYTALKDENQRKNKVHGLANARAITTDRIVWSFDAGRTLLVSFTGAVVSNAIKTAIQDACDTQFGVGKVIIS